jgi:hypothetical protein
MSNCANSAAAATLKVGRDTFIIGKVCSFELEKAGMKERELSLVFAFHPPPRLALKAGRDGKRAELSFLI